MRLEKPSGPAKAAQRRSCTARVKRQQSPHQRNQPSNKNDVYPRESETARFSPSAMPGKEAGLSIVLAMLLTCIGPAGATVFGQWREVSASFKITSHNFTTIFPTTAPPI